MTDKQVVVFDIDGTLLELQKAESEAYVEAFTLCCGISTINDNWSSYHSRSDQGVAREILTRNFGTRWNEYHVAEILEKYYELLQHAYKEKHLIPRVKQGARLLLEKLTQRNIGLALATGNLYKCARYRLEKADLWRYFCCGGYGEDGDTKDIILKNAISRCRELWLDIQAPEDIIYIGDQLSDVEAARANKVRYLRVSSSGEQFNQAVSDNTADYLDINQFLVTLDKLWKQR